MRMFGLIVTVLTGIAVSQGSFLEPSFGQNGTVRLENIRTKFVPKTSLDIQGHIVLSGETENKTQTVVRLQTDGQFDPSFGVRGVLRLKALGQVFIDHQNRVLIVQDKRVLRFHPNGALDSSYGQAGVFTFPTGTQKTKLPMYRVVLNPDGSIWAALIKTPRIISANPDDDDETPQLIKITNQGRLDVSVGNKGFATTAIQYPNMRIDGLQRTSSGGVAMVSSGDFFSPAGVTTYERPIWIHRFNQKGQLEPQQKTNGFGGLACTNGGYVDYFALRSDDTAIIMNSNSGDCNEGKSLWSLDAQNSVLKEFGQELPTFESWYPPFETVLAYHPNGRVFLSLSNSSLNKAILWQDGSLMLHGAKAGTLQIQNISQAGALGLKTEIANPFASGYSLLESEGQILLVGLENGAWSVKKLASQTR